jgi:drug/metabolite transporter (DMT)-like permease
MPQSGAGFRQSAFMKRTAANSFDSVSSGTAKWVGVGLILVSAAGFTINIIISNMAYRDGIGVPTINAVRYTLTTILLFLFLKIRGKQLILPPRERYAGFALGISVFMMGFGYLSAIQYIPVSVAVVIFYTSPFLVAMIARFTENEPITPIRLIAITIAFIGLALALEIHSVAGLNWRGFAFAFLATLGVTSFVVVSSLTIRTAETQAVNFHCLTTGTILFVAFMFISGGPAAHIAIAGWAKMSAASLALTIGYVSLLVGLEIIGPVKTSLLMNAEPIFTIFLAAVLLGERLSLIQLIGAGLVIAGIILITREHAKGSH